LLIVEPDVVALPDTTSDRQLPPLLFVPSSHLSASAVVKFR
jgi:hypothetical protein